MRPLLAAGLLALVSLLTLPGAVLADPALEATVASVTGITRTHDDGFHARAHRRALQIQAAGAFEHCDNCLAEGEAEVLGTSIGAPDPLLCVVAGCILGADDQGQPIIGVGWMGSPDHRAIITDPDYTRIGCAVAQDAASRYWFVCLLAVGAPAAPLPNTAMEAP